MFVLNVQVDGRFWAVLGSYSRLPHAGARCNFKRSCLLFLTSRPKRATGRLRSLAVCMLLANCVSGDTVHDTVHDTVTQDKCAGSPNRYTLKMQDESE